jgi:nucleotide-binding universal stress UspA family protein
MRNSNTMSVSAIKHITVAADGSPASATADRYARELERTGASLSFCSVEAHKPPHEAAEALAACAQEHASEAIVIGSDARQGFVHWRDGIGESLMRIADRPVIFIHEADEFRGGDIAVAISGYDSSHRVLDAAIAMAMALNRDLFLISDITLPNGVDYYALGSNTDAQLVAAAERASAAGVKSGTAIGDGVGPIPNSLIAMAERRDCSMIVTGLHDRSALARFFVGSVAQQIVLHAHVPVAVVHHAYQP